MMPRHLLCSALLACICCGAGIAPPTLAVVIANASADPLRVRALDALAPTCEVPAHAVRRCLLTHAPVRPDLTLVVRRWPSARADTLPLVLARDAPDTVRVPWAGLPYQAPRRP
jgi:hypothetical protein